MTSFVIVGCKLHAVDIDDAWDKKEYMLSQRKKNSKNSNVSTLCLVCHYYLSVKLFKHTEMQTQITYKQ